MKNLPSMNWRLIFKISMYVLLALFFVFYAYFAIKIKPIYELNARLCQDPSIDIVLPAPGAASVKEVNNAPRKIKLKLACTIEQMKKGYQQELVAPIYTGKLFLLGRPGVQGFWMKNVPFNLTLLYLDQNFEVLSVHELVAHEEKPVWSPPETAYAVEIGVQHLHAYRVGDQVLDPQAIVKK